MHVDWSILLGIKTKSVISTQPAPFEFRAQKINVAKDPNRSNPLKKVKISIFLCAQITKVFCHFKICASVKNLDPSEMCTDN